MGISSRFVQRVGRLTGPSGGQVFDTPYKRYMVLELVTGGELFKKLVRTNRSIPLPLPLPLLLLLLLLLLLPLLIFLLLLLLLLYTMYHVPCICMQRWLRNS